MNDQKKTAKRGLSCGECTFFRGRKGQWQRGDAKSMRCRRHGGKCWEHPEELPIGMLVKHLSKFFADYSRQLGEKEGIKDSYRPVLFHLRRHSGISQLELAMHCQVRPSSMSVTLSNMEEDGLIKREIDPNDQRQVKVSLTEAGLLLDETVRTLNHRTEELFCSALEEEEIKELKRLLAKVYVVTVGKEDEKGDEVS